MNNPQRPTFLVLGAAKSGTTTICRELATHPDVLLSDPKEPVFFELEYSEGAEFYWRKYFRHWDGQAVAGEGRVYNLYLPYVPERIEETSPDAKLIIALRNPVDRAYSHWWHRVTRGYERRSFKDAVDQELREFERGQSFEAKLTENSWRNNFFPNTANLYSADVKEVRYLDMGLYPEQLKRYFCRFPREQIRIVLFEELVESPGAILEDLWEFLEVDPRMGIPEPAAHNTASVQVKSRLTFTIEKLSWATGLVHIVPKGVRARIRRWLPQTSVARPPMDVRVRRRLEIHFSSSVAELAPLLDRKGETWNIG